MYKILSTKHFDKLDNPVQKQLKAEFMAARSVLEFLQEVLQEEIRGLENQELSKDSYDSPSFPYLIADMHGSKRAYLRVLNYISEVDKTNE